MLCLFYILNVPGVVPLLPYCILLLQGLNTEYHKRPEGPPILLPIDLPVPRRRVRCIAFPTPRL